MAFEDQFSFVPHVLPLAPRPISGELLSSWLRRVARANALTLGDLLAVAFLNVPGNLGSIDILDDLSPEFVPVIAGLGRISTQWVSALSFSRQFPAWSQQWLMRQSNVRTAWDAACSAIRARYAFCPRCLREMVQKEHIIWIRVEWSCALITHCRLHCLPLHEKCPVCFVEDPVLPGPVLTGGAACRCCYFPLILAANLATRTASEDVLQLQVRLFEDPGFAHQALTSVGDLLREHEGTPLFWLMAEKYPDCQDFLRGRCAPQSNLSQFSWRWRLLLLYALAEINDQEKGIRN